MGSLTSDRELRSASHLGNTPCMYAGTPAVSESVHGVRDIHNKVRAKPASMHPHLMYYVYVYMYS